MLIHPISIIIADVHIIPRNGLAKTLEAREDIHIAATTGDCEALISLCSHHQPDIMIISAAMPGLAIYALIYNTYLPNLLYWVMQILELIKKMWVIAITGSNG